MTSLWHAFILLGFPINKRTSVEYTKRTCNILGHYSCHDVRPSQYALYAFCRQVQIPRMIQSKSKCPRKKRRRTSATGWASYMSLTLVNVNAHTTLDHNIYEKYLTMSYSVASATFWYKDYIYRRGVQWMVDARNAGEQIVAVQNCINSDTIDATMTYLCW